MGIVVRGAGFVSSTCHAAPRYMGLRPPANGAGAFAPLRHTVFRWLWLASLASQMGTWIQNVGAVDLPRRPPDPPDSPAALPRHIDRAFWTAKEDCHATHS